MEDLGTRLAARIQQRDIMTPDKPYEMGRVIGLPAVATPEVLAMHAEQFDKVENAVDADDTADAEKEEQAQDQSQQVIDAVKPTVSKKSKKSE